MNSKKHGVEIPGGSRRAGMAKSGPPGETVTDSPSAAMNPMALTVAQAARLLGVAEQAVRDHVAAGAPTAVDGTINLVGYVAWLNQQLKDRDAD
jgi:plasmid maintenance system antidote protein VapI